MNSFFKTHLFFCINQRTNGNMSCGDFQAPHQYDFAKKWLSKHFPNAYDERLRISQSGCLGRCLKGPVIVSYPQGTWYCYLDQADVERILQHEFLDKTVDVSDLIVTEDI
jgi:(2Fe-2S) ferredoxin